MLVGNASGEMERGGGRNDGLDPCRRENMESEAIAILSKSGRLA